MSRLDDIRAFHARMRPIAPHPSVPDEGTVPVFQRTYDDYSFLLGEVERLEGTARRAVDNESCWVNECGERAAGDAHVTLSRAGVPELRVAFAACSEHIDQFERVQQDPGYVQHWDIKHIWRAREGRS